MVQTHPEVEIVYFPARGRAEPIRFLLAVHDVKWTETAVDYAKMKGDLENFPFGQCPRIVVDGRSYVQTTAVLRHLARKLGAYGANDDESVLIDMYMYAASDARDKMIQLHSNDKYAPEAVAKFIETHVDAANIHGRAGGFHLGHWERILSANGSDFLVGGKLSMADVVLFLAFEALIEGQGMVDAGIAAKVTSQYPAVIAYVDKIKAVPTVAAYLAGPTRHAS